MASLARAVPATGGLEVPLAATTAAALQQTWGIVTEVFNARCSVGFRTATSSVLEAPPQFLTPCFFFLLLLVLIVVVILCQSWSWDYDFE